MTLRVARTRLSIRQVRELAEQGYPAAQYAFGRWQINGENVDYDEKAGLLLLEKAAAKDDAQAIYVLALRRLAGQPSAEDLEKGLEGMKKASVLGSVGAQFSLGGRYELGNGVPREMDRARRYFRLCAAKGTDACQYRLGKLMLSTPALPERDFVQALAWLQLAADQGNVAAKDLFTREAAKLTAAQLAVVSSLKSQLKPGASLH